MFPDIYARWKRNDGTLRPGAAEVTSQHPTFTNAHAQMCAAITAATEAWGEKGQALVRRTYRGLGHHTGRQMIETGIIPSGADLETYGRVSEQIMDTCGLAGWTRVSTSQPEHRTIVPGCAAYLPLFRFLDAPDNICSLPFEWDNGCLDVINGDLQVWPTDCVYRGARECQYVISHRPGSARPEPQMATGDQAGARTGVRGEPTWTNPTAGFLALIGSIHDEYPGRSLNVLCAALRALGERAGQQELIGVDNTAESIAEMVGQRYSSAGFVHTKVRPRTDGSAIVDLGPNPYGPVLGHYSAHEVASKTFKEYDAGWVSVAPGVSLTTVRDGWLDPSSHVLHVTAPG